VIVVAVRWYFRFNLSYPDVQELLAERGLEVDHVSLYRWVQRFTALFADAARFCRHAPGERWFVDQRYVKVNGIWRYMYRAFDQHGQVIDVLALARRDAAAARRSFRRTVHGEPHALRGGHRRGQGVPRSAPRADPAGVAYVEQYANNPIEADHSQLNTGWDRCVDCERIRQHR
jgi:transposase-like protein